MEDKKREDQQSHHGKEPRDERSHPVDHGRPVTPHRSSAQVFERNTKLS